MKNHHYNRLNQSEKKNIKEQRQSWGNVTSNIMKKKGSDHDHTFRNLGIWLRSQIYSGIKARSEMNTRVFENLVSDIRTENHPNLGNEMGIQSQQGFRILNGHDDRTSLWHITIKMRKAQKRGKKTCTRKVSVQKDKRMRKMSYCLTQFLNARKS